MVYLHSVLVVTGVGSVGAFGPFVGPSLNLNGYLGLLVAEVPPPRFRALGPILFFALFVAQTPEMDLAFHLDFGVMQ